MKKSHNHGISDLADRLLRISAQSRKNAFFITGTDTGVGKTWVTCALIEEFQRREIRTGGFKPICCGDRGDALRLWKLGKRKVPLNIVNPIHLKQPVAPVSQKCPSWGKLKQRILKAFAQYKSLGFNMIIVEGAGGLLCPITKNQTMRDLAGVMKLPLVIVASNRLGVLNHTLLTCEAAGYGKLSMVALVLSHSGHSGKTRDASQKNNADILKQLVSVLQFCV